MKMSVQTTRTVMRTNQTAHRLETGMNTWKMRQDRGEAMTWRTEEKRDEDGGLLFRSGPRPLTPVFNFDLKYSNIMYFNY